MSYVRKILPLCFVLLLCACNSNQYDSGYGGYYPGQTTTLGGNSYATGTFRGIQQTVLIPMCSQCHSSGYNGQAGFGVSSYSDVMNAGYVIPGAASQSKLCQVLIGGQMPPTGPLSQSQAYAVCQWIQNGAPQ